MSNNDQYRRQIMNDLAQGDTESLDSTDKSTQEYQNFDDFAQRSTVDERRHMFSSLHPEQIHPSQIEPELQKALAQIKPNERHNIAGSFFKHFKQRGLDEKHLEQQLGLSTHAPGSMTADDITKLASFAYHNHPDIFREVLAEQPGIMKFFSNPLVGAIVGIAAAKWFAGHHK